MGRIRQWIKEPLIQRKNRIYRRQLDDRTELYDTWIRRVENQKQIPKTERPVQVIPYAECTADFSIADLKQEILIFTEDEELLANRAVDEICQVFEQNEQAVLVYGDEDELNSNEAIRMNPQFKPDFSPDTLLSYFYFGTTFAVKKSELLKLVFRKDADPLRNLYSLVLQLCIGKTREQICHINAILSHSHNLSSMCLDDSFDDIRKAASQTLSKSPVKLVSIIIPTKDHPEVLKNCIQSIRERTQEAEYELIVVDNGSSAAHQESYQQLSDQYQFQYIYSVQEFNFSRMCNQGAAQAKGDCLLFLNDDVEVRQTKWLALMCEKASCLSTGAVGVKLYYPESKMIQHDGITNLRLGPVHKMQFQDDKGHKYLEHNTVDRNVLAVTGACLMLRHSLFTKIGGFDENFAVAFNDVDLCFRLFEAGYQNVLVNETHLWHYESLSRGRDEEREKLKRLQEERTLLYQRHRALYARDPYDHPFMDKDILDTNYSFAYQFESGRNAKNYEVQASRRMLRPEWTNECLMISLEYAGSVLKWTENSDELDSGMYLQGYAFVAGSDNSCYKNTILLQEETKGILYEIPIDPVYRPDLFMNLDEEEHAALCGFCMMFEKEDMEQGTYRIGVLAKDTCSRQRLLKFTQTYITI